MERDYIYIILLIIFLIISGILGFIAYHYKDKKYWWYFLIGACLSFLIVIGLIIGYFSGLKAYIRKKEDKISQIDNFKNPENIIADKKRLSPEDYRALARFAEMK